MNEARYEFELADDELRAVASRAMNIFREAGVKQVEIRLEENKGISVSVRDGASASQVAHGSQRITVTAFDKGRKVITSAASFSAESVARLVQAAAGALPFVEADQYAMPASSDIVAQSIVQLDLDAPWSVDITEAIDIGVRAEAAAMTFSPTIVKSEGASVNTSRSRFLVATSEGFCGSYTSTIHGISCRPVASDGTAMRVDNWSSVSRQPERLEAPEAVGRRAASRAVARLGAKQINTRTCSVLFDAMVVTGLLGGWLAAADGMAIVNGSSFLNGQVGRVVSGGHFSVAEDPHLPYGLASRPFDRDGVGSEPRELITDGFLNDYMLSLYAARRLDRAPTGHGDGPANIRLSSKRTTATDSLATMLRTLGEGFYVTHVFGGGINPQTGDYSQGAAGFWVEAGQIAYPVDNVTVAGDVRSLFGDSSSLGADIHTEGAFSSGSLLVEHMRLAGR